MVNWKWAEPLKELNAIKGEGSEQRVDFEALKNCFDDLMGPFTDAGPKM
jgi:hypothetical protein